MKLFPGGDGAEVIYALRNSNGLSSKIAKEFENAGQNARKFYQRRLPSNPAKDYYYVIRDTANNESIIVEYGFADSTGDDVTQLKNDWKTLAEAVVKAVTEYVGATYKPPLGTDYYIVKSGDTLWNIAKKFGVSLETLKKENNLTSNALSIGQYLKIPSPDLKTEPTEYYIVKSGDSLWKIANQYNVTVNDLINANNLTSTTLQIGQQLIIPSASTTPIPPSSSTIEYTVKSGDSLWAIASRYNTTVDAIKDLNNLTTNTLQIGQVLKIPNTSNNSYTEYTVKSGDSLWKIASQYNTTVDAIKSLNNLTTNTLQIGQVLRIPK